MNTRVSLSAAQPPGFSPRLWPRRAAAALLVVYKRIISPLLPRACRFYPSCSEYARLAILKHGLLKGTAKAGWRILRCNPFSQGGEDYP